VVKLNIQHTGVQVLFLLYNKVSIHLLLVIGPLVMMKMMKNYILVDVLERPSFP
jgi:hypothetical protein